MGAVSLEALVDEQWAELDAQRLEKMRAAGEEIQTCYRVLTKVSANIVGELLKTADTFYEWDHYPEGDVYDHETHGQYYYHSHRGAENEHGHFHTFLRRKGIPQDIQPDPDQGDADLQTGDDVLSHIIAISMDPAGYPFSLFSTNRWVTGENWFKADDVISMLDHFEIDHAWPSWPVNRWISAMMVLFRPQVISLLHARDETVQQWQTKHSDRDVFEDRDLEITSIQKISVEDQILRIERELANRVAT